MRKNYRAQAAIEFLVTYGWAIMGVLIVIGALAYFGIFNTQRYVNDVCYFGDQLTCEDYMLTSSSWTYVQLRNNFGVPIDIVNVVLKSDYGTTDCNQVNISVSSNLQPGTMTEIGCNLTNAKIAINNKFKYRMIVTFQHTGSTNQHNQTGDLTVTSQK